MFKFIFATLVLLAAAAAADDMVDILEMAYDALDHMDDVDNTLGNDDTSENIGYVYNDSALEDNINIAVNAAILDKYGHAVTTELSQQAGKPSKTPKVIAKMPANPPTKTEVTYENIDKPVKAAPKVVKTYSSDSTGKSDNSDTVTHYVNQVNADGSYTFSFAQSSGLEFQEMGQGGQYAKGSYQYISPEGEYISVTYTADENGFHPESNILPTPPPVPSYIQKALDYIRDHPSAEELAKREERANQI